jgi:tellurite resistance protein
MIIFGTRGVTSTTSRGNFHCPACGGERQYAGKRMRRFFTLYFIPLVPMGVLQEWVECAKCGGTFKPEVLRHDPRARQSAVRAAVMVAARRVLALAAGPAPGPDARAAARKAHETLFGEAWPEAELDDDLRRAAGATPLEPLGRVPGDLNAVGKEAILTEAVRVATAAGPIDPAVSVMLAKAAAALGLSEAHWRGIAASAAALVAKA